jgi:hypothetical protein
MIILSDVLLTTLVTIFATIFGIAFGTIYLIMTNKEAREHIVVVSLFTLPKIIDPNKVYNLLNSVSNMITSMFSNSIPVPTPLPATVDGSILKIPFTLNGKAYVYMAVHNSRSARNPKIIMARKGEVKENLNHYSGITMTVTAEDLGVDEILEMGDLDQILNI